MSRQRADAAGAFGDVLAGHLHVDAAGMGAFRLMHRHETPHLAQDRIEGPRLVARCRLDRVAMHGIAGPDHDAPLAFHRADQFGQMLFDLVGAEAGDQRQAARLVVGIERVDEPDQFVGLQRRAAFEADRVLDAAAELDMGMVGLARAVADPQHMARCRVPVAAGRIDAGQRLLVAEQQRLVAGEEIGRAQLRRRVGVDAAGAHEGHAPRRSGRRAPGSARRPANPSGNRASTGAHARDWHSRPGRRRAAG